MSSRICPHCGNECIGCRDQDCGLKPCPSCRAEIVVHTERQRGLDDLADRVRTLLRWAILQKHMANINYDALQGYYFGESNE